MRKLIVVIACLAIFLIGCSAAGTPIQPPPAEPTTAPTTAPVVQVVHETVIVQQTVVVQQTAVPPPTAIPPALAAPTSALAPAAASNIAQKVVFHASVGGSAYDVVYDPAQGGSSDHPALGWWYQPNLPPGPQRVAHEVAIILQAPATYRFTGPECSAWLNYDGSHPWEQGTLLVSRQNIERLSVVATNGGGAKAGEAWVAVKCATSAASGFSFEKLP